LTLKLVSKLNNPDKDRIEDDLKIVDQLNNMISMYETSNEKEVIRKGIIIYLYKLLLLDDGG